MKSELLRVLIAHTEDAYVAQCLEHDIAVQAPDIETLQRRFEDAVFLEMQDDGLAALPPAPEEFFAQWEEGAQLEGAPENTEMRMAA